MSLQTCDRLTYNESEICVYFVSLTFSKEAGEMRTSSVETF